MTQWRDFQLFLAKIDVAFNQQSKEVERLEMAYQKARDAWQAYEKK